MIPNMTALLSSSDHKMVESACMCFSRLVDSCHTSETQLEQIVAHGALVQLVRLLKPGEGEGRTFELSTGTYTSVVKTLAMSCRGSPRIAVMLLEEGIVQVCACLWRRRALASVARRFLSECWHAKECLTHHLLVSVCALLVKRGCARAHVVEECLSRWCTISSRKRTTATNSQQSSI
jgi:hypothetical protein